MSKPSEWAKINLTIQQYSHAMTIGRARNAIDRAAGVRDRKVNEDSIVTDVTGAVGEAAWSLFMGVPWDRAVVDPAKLKAPGEPLWDLCGYHVRSTCYKGGRLLIHPGDPDDAPFVLAYIAVPVVTFAGWAYGWEAKRLPLQRISRRPGATSLHAVPYQLLRPIASLIPRTALELLSLPCYVPPTPRTALQYLTQPYFREGLSDGRTE